MTMDLEEATSVAAALRGALDAASELMAEMRGARAANWGVINAGLYRAERLLAAIHRAFPQLPERTK